MKFLSSDCLIKELAITVNVNLRTATYKETTFGTGKITAINPCFDRCGYDQRERILMGSILR